MRKFLCEDGDGQFVLLTEQLLPEDVEIELIETEEISKAELGEVFKPYPGEHTCELARGTRFSEYRSAWRTSGGKRYRILFGHIAGSAKWKEASYRYPKGAWRRDAAAGHCSRHGGRFVGATKAEKSEMEVRIQKTEDEGLVYGIAMEPHTPDSDRDFETSLTIRNAAHKYMIHLSEKAKAEMVGIEHEEIADAVPVESYIADHDFYYEGTPQTDEYKITKGSWVLVTWVKDKDTFEKIKNGDLVGYSIQGWGRREPVE